MCQQFARPWAGAHTQIQVANINAMRTVRSAVVNVCQNWRSISTSFKSIGLLNSDSANAYATPYPWVWQFPEPAPCFYQPPCSRLCCYWSESWSSRHLGSPPPGLAGRTGWPPQAQARGGQIPPSLRRKSWNNSSVIALTSPPMTSYIPACHLSPWLCHLPSLFPYPAPMCTCAAWLNSWPQW